MQIPSRSKLDPITVLPVLNRLVLRELVEARFGYMEQPDVPKALRAFKFESSGWKPADGPSDGEAHKIALEPGKLSPYTAVVLFSAGVLAWLLTLFLGWQSISGLSTLWTGGL